MDLKTLFHNPDSLSDNDLLKLSNKIKVQQALPRQCAISGALLTYLYDAQVMRRSFALRRILVASAACYVIGAIGTY